MRGVALRAAVLTGMFGATAGSAMAGGTAFSAPSYNASFSFTETAVGHSVTGIAYDGTASYYTVSGGNATGVRLARYTASGSLVSSYSPGFDFRSIDNVNGTLYARRYASNALFPMVSPGVFAATGTTLAGRSADPQAAVAFDGTDFVALGGGAVARWTTAGAYLGTVALAGYGDGDAGPLAGTHMTAAGGFWYTYATSTQTLSAWSPITGQRLDTTVLNGASTNDADEYSLSFANGRVWVDTGTANPASVWNGYAVVVSVPEPTAVASLTLTAIAVSCRRSRQRSTGSRVAG